VHDRRVEAGFHALVEEHRVEHLAGGRVEAERDVGEPEDGRDARQLALDRTDALDGLDAVVAALLHAGRERQGEGSKRRSPARGRSGSRPRRRWRARPAASTRPCGPGPPRRCRCTRPPPRTGGRGSRSVEPGARASPSSKFTEFKMGRPPSHWRAASATGPSVVSTMRGPTTGWRTCSPLRSCRRRRRRRCSPRTRR